jgi:hypothetical protein
MKYNKELHDWVKSNNVLCEHAGVATVTYTTAVITALLDEIERLQAERRWIPVSERLPEVKGRYICSIMYKEEPKKIWVEQRYWDGYGWDMYTSIVTHWMPLPEPPESEG